LKAEGTHALFLTLLSLVLGGLAETDRAGTIVPETKAALVDSATTMEAKLKTQTNEDPP
jgi:hypothetical protein